MKKRGGWVPVPPPMVVCLLEPQHVKRWGYEVDRETVFSKLLGEAARSEPGMLHLDVGDPHLTIAEHHPLFKKYWEIMPKNLNESLKPLGMSTQDKRLLGDIHHEIVEAYVQGIVRRRMDRVRPRKLWMEDFPTDTEHWRGPWEVLFKRVVKTGTYYPATGGSSGGGFECEPDPACLADEKTHVLYWIEHKDRNRFEDRVPEKFFGPFYVERAKTTDWTNEWSARILMEAK